MSRKYESRFVKEARWRWKRPTGLLVTLKPLFLNETERMADEFTRDQETDLGDGLYSVSIAYHHDVPCALNDPCLRFWPHGVHERNVLAVLEHEGLHHTFLRIGEDDANNMLDNIMPTIQRSCYRLRCTNHQIGADT